MPNVGSRIWTWDDSSNKVYGTVTYIGSDWVVIRWDGSEEGEVVPMEHILPPG